MDTYIQKSTIILASNINPTSGGVKVGPVVHAKSARLYKIFFYYRYISINLSRLGYLKKWRKTKKKHFLKLQNKTLFFRNLS